MKAALASRAEFERALSVLSEGKRVHGLYATEDAKALLQPIARYHWRQTALIVFLTLNGGALARTVTNSSDVWVSIAGSVLGFVVLGVALTAPVLRRLFAPAGFTVLDVGRAFSAVWGTSKA